MFCKISKIKQLTNENYSTVHSSSIFDKSTIFCVENFSEFLLHIIGLLKQK